MVEWYDFGDQAPYESANRLILGLSAQHALAAALNIPISTPDDLAAHVADRFSSFFEVATFLADRGIEPRRETDFLP